MEGFPVAKILVIDDDPMVCGVLTNRLLDGGSEAEWVACSRLGAQMLVRDRFDLAVIHGPFEQSSEAALAEIAASENTAVLLLNGSADADNVLESFGFPYAQEPFSLDRLPSEATEAIARSGENVARVKAAAAAFQAGMAAASGRRHPETGRAAEERAT
jgi:DNA-binding NtrC family response regulator